MISTENPAPAGRWPPPAVWGRALRVARASVAAGQLSAPQGL